MEQNESKLLNDIFLELKNKTEVFLKEKIEFNFGAELEFYIIQKEEILFGSDEFLRIENNLKKLAKDKFINIIKLEKEDGFNQFEVHFEQVDNPVILAYYIEKTKEILKKINLNVNFEAKPIENLPGNSIHFHISLFNKLKNFYIKNNEIYHNIFYYSIGGMLSKMKESMFIFSPTEKCYNRYFYARDDQIYKHYPINYSWGFNNRTCAIRIPSILSSNYKDARIEHRVCSSMTNPTYALIAILSGIIHGIENKIQPIDAIYGDAFDYNYDYIERFPINLKKAKFLFEDSILEKKFKEYQVNL